MKISAIKHVVITVFCIALSQSAYSADELYDSELSGLAYINIPFSGNKALSSPTFSFTVTQTPTTNITSSSANNLNYLLSNPKKKALFDMQYDLTEQHWSRFAFGGINSLVYDDVLHADGGGPVIDPKLLGIGIAATIGIVIAVNNNGDDDPPPCPVVTLTLNAQAQPCGCKRFTNGIDPCAPDSDMRLKRDIVELVTLGNGIKLYSFRYLWEDTVYVGVMAQDLLEHESYKDAVVIKQSGFYAVHYDMLGLQMITLEEWHLSQGNIYANYELAANL